MLKMFKFEQQLNAAPEPRFPDGALELCEQIDQAPTPQRAADLEAQLRGLLRDNQAQYDCAKRTFKWIRTFAHWKFGPVVPDDVSEAGSARHNTRVRSRDAMRKASNVSARSTQSTRSTRSAAGRRERALSSTTPRQARPKATAIPQEARGTARSSNDRRESRLAVLGAVQYKRLLESEKRLAAQRRATDKTTSRLKAGTRKQAWTPL